MAKVSPFSPFRLEDFPTQRDWIDKLFLPINTVLTEVAAALNGLTTFGDNIPTFTKVLSGTNLTLPQSFQMPSGFVPVEMRVAQAIKAGSAIAMIGAWSISGDTVTVNALYEVSESGNALISTGTKYSITLRFN